MSDLVYIENKQPVTTSETVAEYFGKRHADVLRDIRGLIKQVDNDFTERNFAFCHKNNELQNGKPQPYYTITKDGFMLLCMGYTGAKAMQIKLAYINAFNQMYHALVKQQQTLQDMFNTAERNYQLVSQYASHAGKSLNYLGKQVKPACKAERDELFNELQLVLDFNSKEAIA